MKKMKTKTRGVWKKIGVVGVDSGQLMICDPCYIDDNWENESFTDKPPTKNFSYNAVCKKTFGKKMAGQIKYQRGHDGLAVAFSSGFGDGCYDVWGFYEDCGEFGTSITKVEIRMGD